MRKEFVFMLGNDFLKRYKGRLEIPYVEIDTTNLGELYNRVGTDLLKESRVGLHDYNVGDVLKSVSAIIEKMEEAFDRNEKMFVKLWLKTKYGSIYVNYFSPDPEKVEEMKVLRCVLVDLKVKKSDFFNSGKGTDLISLEVPNKPIEITDILSRTEFELSDLINEFEFYCNLLSEPHRDLLMGIMNDYIHLFSMDLAAKNHHHNYLGGLLEHTVGIGRILYHLTNAENISKSMLDLNYQISKMAVIEARLKMANNNKLPIQTNIGTHINEIAWKVHEMLKTKSLNIDNLFLSALIHDIGKLYEYDLFNEGKKYEKIFNNINYEHDDFSSKLNMHINQVGFNVGHISLGQMIFSKYSQKYTLDFKDIIEILNCIGSHHYKSEWGSPVSPVYPSSLLLCYADYVDATINKFKKDSDLLF